MSHSLLTNLLNYNAIQVHWHANRELWQAFFIGTISHSSGVTQR